MWKITLENDRMVFTPFFGDSAADQDPDQLREELQDLKLENDRLKQREDKMLRVIRSIACDYGDCEDCLFFGSDNLPCGDAGDDFKACVNLLGELEDIG